MCNINGTIANPTFTLFQWTPVQTPCLLGKNIKINDYYIEIVYCPDVIIPHTLSLTIVSMIKDRYKSKLK